ncbi:3-oxoacyl-[acyl-carrier-protein] synthase, mitochondrial [Armadillidium vulgare]|nr:3-oxoacyl-[acyl-carrier-protein] synthase, mitochondrial [Armadillidium vulgare]
MTSRRVVVTGLGLITPLGVGTSYNWQQLINGISGIKQLDGPLYKQMPCRVAGLIPRGNQDHELDLDKHFSSSGLRSMTKATAYALIAAQEALEDANWLPEEEGALESTGVAVGLGMVDLDEIQEAGKAIEKKYNKLNPFFVPKILTNMPAGQISIKYKFQGPNHAVSTACATGCHAIGDAFRFIKNNDADVMVCGGTEASVSPLGIAGFCRLRALSTNFNDSPQHSSRPFDKDRDGFVMGEGAGILVLEEMNHAIQRNAKIYGEILGYGLSGDGFHITSPRNDGKGGEKVMKKALNEARVNISSVKYINAHATSTPVGDKIEVQAIKRVFGSHAENIKVSSTKGATGHLLGAAGAVEAIFTVLACHSGLVPPTINLNNPSPELDLDFVPITSVPWIQSDPLRIALCNSFGFGGTNACICISSY